MEKVTPPCPRCGGQLVEVTAGISCMDCRGRLLTLKRLEELSGVSMWRISIPKMGQRSAKEIGAYWSRLKAGKPVPLLLPDEDEPTPPESPGPTLFD